MPCCRARLPESRTDAPAPARRSRSRPESRQRIGNPPSARAALLLAAVVTLTSATAGASDDLPPDLRDTPQGERTIARFIGPGPLETFGRGKVRAYAQPAWRRDAQRAWRAAERALPEVAATVGVEPEKILPIWIVVASSEQNYTREAPSWSAAVAQPEFHLIVLSGPALRRSAMDAEETVVHEIVHLALHARLGDTGWMPRWLDEGLAMHFSGYSRAVDPLAASYRGEVRLRDLTDRFPQHPTLARQAYLESEAAVRVLLERGSLPPLLDRLAAGEDFDAAFEVVYDESWLHFADRIHGEVAESLALDRHPGRRRDSRLGDDRPGHRRRLAGALAQPAAPARVGSRGKGGAPGGMALPVTLAPPCARRATGRERILVCPARATRRECAVAHAAGEYLTPAAPFHILRRMILRSPPYDPPEYVSWQPSAAVRAEWEATLAASKPRRHLVDALGAAQHLNLFMGMLRTRLTDTWLKRWVMQGVISKAWLGTGEEAVTVGCVQALRKAPDGDIVGPVIRNAGACREMGLPAAAMFKAYLGTHDQSSKGRDFLPGDLRLGVIPPISMLATSVPVCAGAALAFKQRGEDRVALTWVGDGSTRTGDFHEGMSVAAALGVPLVVVIQNNQVALGTRVEVHTRAPLDGLHAAYGVKGYTCDGNNVLDVYATAMQAVTDCRKGRGPVLVTATTFRMGGHATHDEAEARQMLPAALFQFWGERDPLGNYAEWLLHALLPLEDGLQAHGLDAADLPADRSERNRAVLERAQAAAHAEIEAAAELALQSRAHAMPVGDDVERDVYAELGE